MLAMTTVPYSLRWQPQPQDPEVVRRLVASTGFFSPQEVAVAGELVEEWLARGEASGYHFLFLEQAGAVVAYACFGPVPFTDGRFDLYWIAVDQELRGQGLGRMVLAAVEARLPGLGCRRLYAETSGRPQYRPTCRFYETAGFDLDVRQRDFYRDGEDKLIYVKPMADPA